MGYVTENITKQRPVTSTVMETVQRPVTSTVMDTVAKQIHGVVTEQHHATVRTTQQVHQSQQMIPGPVTQSGPVTTGSNYVGTVGTGVVGGSYVGGGVVSGGIVGGYGGGIVTSGLGGVYGGVGSTILR